MTPTQAGAVMRRGRNLLRAGRLTAKQFVLLDCLVWSCRSPGATRLTVSFTRMAKLAAQARATAIAGVRVLERLGVLSRIRRRVRVIWGGSIASRQATNIYVLNPPDTEYAGRTALKEQPKKEDGIEVALARLGSAMRASTQKDRRPVRSGGLSVCQVWRERR